MLAGEGETALIDPSEYALDPLRADQALILHRGPGRVPRASSAHPVLVLRPAPERPAPDTLRRIEQGVALRGPSRPRMGRAIDQPDAARRTAGARPR